VLHSFTPLFQTDFGRDLIGINSYLCFHHKTERAIRGLATVGHGDRRGGHSQFGFAQPNLVRCLPRLRAEVNVCRPAGHTSYAAKVCPVILGDASSCGVAFGPTTNA
jgi:hypothetical protein